ncbi:CATRA system-associated protein [Streptomyces sp. NPDC002870]|uniref:CATRA system-associated protein n=1 Tax=Streptomyces sp. NPDC002870 TaxID=3364666 RepID=UPI003675B228
MDLSEGDRAPVNLAEERDDAVGALTGIVGLVLPPSGWALVERALESMETALRAGDPGALSEATGQLELVGPSRIRTQPAEEGESASQDVVDRVNRLVHSLQSEALDGDLTEDEPASGDPH